MGLFPSDNQLFVAASRYYTEAQYGYDMSFNELRMDTAKLAWGTFLSREERKVNMEVTSARVEMHFNIKGCSSITCEDNGALLRTDENQHSLFYQESLKGQYNMFAGMETSFFEVEVNVPIFAALISEESPFLHQFYNQMLSQNHHWPGYSLDINGQMHQIIHDITYTSYTGHMKRLFLEAKMVELFLLQASVFDAQLLAPATDLRPQDVERLYAAREYLDTHYHDTCSILSLSLIAGLNQKKLKQGFKSLFGHTVFGYLSHVRMEKARQLLLDEKKTVGEVAELVGYQYPQHFTAAFRRKYGILPGSLKN
mgnify:CR=1 FL=1